MSLNAGKSDVATEVGYDADRYEDWGWIGGNPKTQEKIKGMTEENTVMIFSKGNCPHCKKAKASLTELGVEFKVCEIDQVEGNVEDFGEALKTVSGSGTVP